MIEAKSSAKSKIFVRGGSSIMATTRIMPLHIGKGRTESRAIRQLVFFEQTKYNILGGAKWTT